MLTNLNAFIKLQDVYSSLRKPNLPSQLVYGFQYLDLYEVDGIGDNPEIVRWARELEAYWAGKGDDRRAAVFRRYQHDSDEWCTLYLTWVLHNDGWKTPVEGLWSIAYGKMYEAVLGNPEPGDICVTWRDDPQKVLPPRSLGHAALVVEKQVKDYVELLGGNQHNGVNVITKNLAKLIGFRRLTPQWRLEA